MPHKVIVVLAINRARVMLPDRAKVQDETDYRWARKARLHW